MSKDTTDKQFDSIDYCVNFWDGAIDAEDEIDHHMRELPRHVRAADDLA